MIRSMKLGNKRGIAVALASTTIQFASSYNIPRGPLPLVAAAAAATTTTVSFSCLNVRGGATSYNNYYNRSSHNKQTSSHHLGMMSNNNNNNKMDQSTTWSFDKPCTTMAWTEMSTVSLKISTSITDNWDEDDDKADLVVVGVFAPKKKHEDDDENENENNENENEEGPSTTTISLEGKAKELDEKLDGILSTSMIENAKEFKHGRKVGSVTPTQRIIFKNKSTKRYVVMGLGTSTTEDSLLEKDGNVGFAIGKTLANLGDTEKKVKNIKVLLPESLIGSADGSVVNLVFKDISSSFYTNLYSDNRFRTGKNIKMVAEDLETVTFVLDDEGSSSSSSSSPDVVIDGGGDAAAAAAEVVAALDEGKKLATGIYMTKDIVNAPHNVLNSLSLADTARRIAAEESSHNTLTCTILGKEECEDLGMGAYLGVARGSETEPQFIHIKYSPPLPPPSADDCRGNIINKRVGIVGKGLLYDTGGYNIKTQMMELMKKDCSGAAAVLGAARAVAALQPAGVEAHFVVAACENMINERAMVASDILTASNGKTIEVMNTDAEGRLTLADALVYCDKELDCESIIDLATLTGACTIALGKKVSGFWTDNDDLARELENIAKQTEEKTWRMPLEKSYDEQLKSKIADISNLGGRYGGAITAALFLQNFVCSKKPFAHFDCSGPVWDYDNAGATGYGAKLVTEWVCRQGIEKE